LKEQTERLERKKTIQFKMSDRCKPGYFSKMKTDFDKNSKKTMKLEQIVSYSFTLKNEQ
jgi:hypothetical protein